MDTESVDMIECIYENMMIKSSMVICENPTEMAFVIDALEAKSFPCRFASSLKKSQSPHNVIVCTVSELQQDAFWENIEGIEINCIFLIGKDVFFRVIKELQNRLHDNPSVEKFIFTL